MQAPELKSSTLPREEFRAVVATAGVGISEMIEAALLQILPEFEVHVYAPGTNRADELLTDPELSRAHLIIALMNNLRYDTPTTPQGCESPTAFLRALRPTTRAILLITSAIWKDHTGPAFLEAGADLAVRLPFSMTHLKQAVKRALPTSA